MNAHSARARLDERKSLQHRKWCLMKHRPVVLGTIGSKRRSGEGFDFLWIERLAGWQVTAGVVGAAELFKVFFLLVLVRSFRNLLLFRPIFSNIWHSFCVKHRLNGHLRWGSLHITPRGEDRHLICYNFSSFSKRNRIFWRAKVQQSDLCQLNVCFNEVAGKLGRPRAFKPLDKVESNEFDSWWNVFVYSRAQQDGCTRWKWFI